MGLPGMYLRKTGVMAFTLMSIYDLVKSEARLFKYGSGTGTNFSAIRGKQEKLSGGGTSSGLMLNLLQVMNYFE